jgi:hypothetical protein
MDAGTVAGLEAGYPEQIFFETHLLNYSGLRSYAPDADSIPAKILHSNDLRVKYWI